MLKFSFKKFIDKKVNGEKITMPADVVKIFKTWDGKTIHRFGPKSTRRNVFGEECYILVGTEKIAVNEEFSTNE